MKDNSAIVSPEEAKAFAELEKAQQAYDALLRLSTGRDCDSKSSEDDAQFIDRLYEMNYNWNRPLSLQFEG